MESASYVLSFRMVFFYLMITGWIFLDTFYILVAQARIRYQEKLNGLRVELPPPLPSWTITIYYLSVSLNVFAVYMTVRM